MSDDNAYITSLLPEIEDISDARLRGQVAAIWVECWRESRWERIEDVPKHPNLGMGRGLIDHVRSVTQQALAAAEIVQARHGIAADRDTLLAAGLLHDVSKLIEYEPDGNGGARTTTHGELIQHAAYAAHKAWEHGLSEEIVHLILSHTPASNKPPQTLEGLILHYVDFLDTDALLFDAGAGLELHEHW